MKIYLVRHGQTTGDIEDRYGGDYEDHLTEEGQRQATELANKLEAKGIEVFFCSPRLRALETADIVNKQLNLNIETIEDLRERNHYGILTGLTKKEGKEKYPNEVKLLGDFRNTLSDGEGYDSFGLRIRNALRIATDSDHKTVAIITHGGPIRFIFREVLGLGEIEIGDCAFAELDYNDKELKVVGLDGIKLLKHS